MLFIPIIVKIDQTAINNYSKSIMLLTAKDLTLHFNQKTYLNKLTFELNSGDIIGLIGRNGCGKTSLMKILVGQQDHDEGSIVLKKGAKIGYLSQDFSQYPDNYTVNDRLGQASQWILELVLEFEKTPYTDDNKHFLMDLVTRHHGWELPDRKSVV